MEYVKQHGLVETVVGYGNLARKLQQIMNSGYNIADIKVTRETINDDFKVSVTWFEKK